MYFGNVDIWSPEIDVASFPFNYGESVYEKVYSGKGFFSITFD